jgi:HSP20 family protein
MANANQSSSGGRPQGRQQNSELGKSMSAQQGGQGNQRNEQQKAWQSPGTEQQTSGALRPQRGTWPVAPSPFGALGDGPLAMMRRISEDMDHLFESFGFGRGLFPAGFGHADVAGFAGAEDAASLWAPHIEVYERDGKLVINADLPGVKKEDVNVEITPDIVTIRGQRKQEKTSHEGGFYRSERSYGSFYRTIPLPEGVDTEAAAANFRDGVLRIEINAPQRPARGRTLQISSDASSDVTSRTTGGSESAQMGGGSQQR